MRGLSRPYGVGAAGFLVLSTVFSFLYNKYLNVLEIYDIICTPSTFFLITHGMEKPQVRIPMCRLREIHSCISTITLIGAAEQQENSFLR